MNFIKRFFHDLSLEWRLKGIVNTNKGIAHDELFSGSGLSADDFNKYVMKLERKYELFNGEGKYFTFNHVYVAFMHSIKKLPNCNNKGRPLFTRENYELFKKYVPIPEESLKQALCKKIDYAILNFWDGGNRVPSM